ncbi:RING-H2 finger protein ATL43 [Cornus florida]|uniref:RING-H2 finger protein ATL43 n=1 Tax=Cornus florida TaxID=4283 RepID=UPI0028982F34|nr:RING-H2 finger protein ATL43 [Cornus florida]
MPLSSLLCIFIVDPSRRISNPPPQSLFLLRKYILLSNQGLKMGIFMLQRLSILFFVITRTCSIIPPMAPTNGGDYGGDVPTFSNPPSPIPPPPPPQSNSSSPFKPSIAVIVGVLTTMFSVTFLLLLYAKHCKRGNGYADEGPNSRGPTTSAARKHSGIDRAVVDLLPIFRFKSLRGQKDGLECAVCLNRFEPMEVLRLLPKCKHAFHVECVDTWLDAHSTCPLCRYRVDPEDILLVENDTPQPPPQEVEQHGIESSGFRRVSGRHSSAGERGTGYLQINLQRTSESEAHDPTSSRRSLDSSKMRKKSNEPTESETHDPTSSRRSLDVSKTRKKSNETVSVGCFDRHRKDGLLLTEGLAADRTSFEHRFEHRIIVSGGSRGLQQRWSDVQPSDLLYLRSEMIISDSRRLSLGSRTSARDVHHQHEVVAQHRNSEGINGNNGWQNHQNGRSVINSRSVSEITGLSRFSDRTSNNHQQLQEQERQTGLVSRWLAWISQSHSLPAVRSVSRDSRLPL